MTSKTRVSPGSDFLHLLPSPVVLLLSNGTITQPAVQRQFRPAASASLSLLPTHPSSPSYLLSLQPPFGPTTLGLWCGHPPQGPAGIPPPPHKARGSKNTNCLSQVCLWRCIPVIPAPERREQEAQGSRSTLTTYRILGLA